MYGATLSQSICYTRWFPNDPWPTKAFVCAQAFLHPISDVFSLGVHDVVGYVTGYSIVYRYNPLSQLSRHFSYDWEYSNPLDSARVMPSKLLVELRKRTTVVSPGSSEMQSTVFMQIAGAAM